VVALPAEAGVYALLMHLPRQTVFQAGALGPCRLQRGWYLYVGSARGPGGLRARVGRHLRRGHKRLHWHMDHLRPWVRIHAVWWTTLQTTQERDWVLAAARLPTAVAALPGFGASDSTCSTHLLAFTRRPQFEAFREQAGAARVTPVPQAWR